jgi:amidohydrolase
MVDTDRLIKTYLILHEMPEPGFKEVKTAAFLAQQLSNAGYDVQTGIAGTGVIGVLHSGKPGPVLAIRADIDALKHVVDGVDRVIHSCGHDAHAAMVLAVAEEMAKRGLGCGTLKIIFQPGEETLFGALRMIEAGVIDDVDVLLGIHLRPAQEAGRGQATPALYHGSICLMEATITGQTAHGARPHLGVNAIDAAAAVVNAVNAIRMNPIVPTSIKVTKLQAGGAALNAIPDKAEMALDLRAQENSLMDDLITKATRAIESGAASVGAAAKISVKGKVPAGEYNAELLELAREAIINVLSEKGLLPPITTPGCDDFHFYVKHKPAIKACFIGLGCDLLPGLHHPEMKFDIDALLDGVNILLYMAKRIIYQNQETAS